MNHIFVSFECTQVTPAVERIKNPNLPPAHRSRLCADMIWEAPITGAGDVQRIADYISNAHSLLEVNVISWSRYESPKEEEGNPGTETGEVHPGGEGAGLPVDPGAPAGGG